MSNIKFIDTVKNQVATRVKQIDDKKQAIIIQTDKLKEKEKQITATELLYKSNFEEQYYSKSLQQKKEKEQVISIIDTLEHQLNLMGMPVVELDSEEVKKQIFAYVTEETHLKEAIEEVDKYKALYLEKVNNYLQTIEQMVATREDINSIGEYMTPETKAVIVPALQICSDDMKKYNQTIFAVGGQWDIFDMSNNNNLGIELKAKSEIISRDVGRIWGRTI